ncbi:MAG: SCO family protein [Pseudomonadota bacterium]
MQRSIIALLATFALALALAGCDAGKPAPKFKSGDITGAEFARGFTLTDHDGARRSLADFQGKAVLLFFGFTHCPDVCPTTLARAKLALQQLGADAGKVRVLFVSLDPERDTPAVLKGYVTAFDPGFVGLTGTPEEIKQVAQDFRVMYQKSRVEGQEGYSVDHSTQTYVYDPQGRLRLYVSHTQDVDVLVHDVKLLLAGA